MKKMDSNFDTEYMYWIEHRTPIEKSTRTSKKGIMKYKQQRSIIQSIY